MSLSLEGSDVDKGVVQQHASSSSELPASDGSASIAQQASAPYDTPAPSVPPSAVP